MLWRDKVIEDLISNNFIHQNISKIYILDMLTLHAVEQNFQNWNRKVNMLEIVAFVCHGYIWGTGFFMRILDLTFLLNDTIPRKRRNK